jgi:hypothetical protein
VRTRDGTFTKFDPSNGTFGEQQIGTTMAINPAGAVTGYYQTGDYTWHDFLRAPNGTFTKFDFPIPGAGSQGTRRERSRDGTITQTSMFMASCGSPPTKMIDTEGSGSSH